ncbi:Yip1 domain-containing protein [Seinonella peptonophila]|uniref:Yip1 domain-containing protein n=1 Tax=Seinonella peptonophila TaxID=112248 RepID=A0A1M4VJ58_9BACL|nr:Yip1 family protein [Seinonella peptonophila]SHE69014.1 Yip1 domain-containing protein [Seinonella peptonophila]
MEEAKELQQEESEQLKKELSCLSTITAPKEHFTQIKEKPLFLKTLLIYSGITTFLVLLANYIGLQNPATLKAILAQHPGETAASIQQSTLIFSGILGLIAAGLTSLLGAAVSWLIVKGLRGEANFQQLFSFQTHLYLLAVCALLVDTAFTLFTGNLSPFSELSLGALLPVEGLSKVALSSIEPFNIWTVILYGLGLQKIANLTPTKAWFGAAIFFLLGAVFSVAIAAIGQ